MAASTFAFAVEAPPSPIAFEPSKVYDSPIPGGGSMYFFRRVDVRAEGAASSETKLLALGSGSFATTMDCVRVLAGARTPVAIKQIAMDKRAAEAAEKEEVRGLKALSGRAHPNIVRYMAMFRGDDGGGRVRISFVFERCPLAVPFAMGTETSAAGVIIPTENVSQPPRAGCDLANNPICRAPCTLREAVCVVRQVLHALAYLHSCAPPIVHRDIKPENILIWGSDKCPATGENLLTVKVTDYGTLRTAPGGSSAEDLTLGRGTQGAFFFLRHAARAPQRTLSHTTQHTLLPHAQCTRTPLPLPPQPLWRQRWRSRCRCPLQAGARALEGVQWQRTTPPWTCSALAPRSFIWCVSGQVMRDILSTLPHPPPPPSHFAPHYPFFASGHWHVPQPQHPPPLAGAHGGEGGGGLGNVSRMVQEARA